MKSEDRLKELIESGDINSADAAKQEGFIQGWNEALRIHDVVGRSEQFNCLGGNYAKGIKPCSEWCGEDMCQKPSN